MKKLKLLIVANNCKWDTWSTKIDWLKKFFIKSGFDLEITKKDTNYKNVPFSLYKSEKTRSLYGVDHDWYNKNITPPPHQYDMVIFQMNAKDWKGEGARGWRTDKDQGVVEMQVGCDEREWFTAKIDKQGQWVDEQYQGWEWFTAHEISHAIYFMYNLPDRTHELYDKYGIDGLPEGLKQASVSIQIIDAVKNKKTMAINKPQYIIVHHTGGTNANPMADTSHHTAAGIRNWHKNGNGWPDIGYHWVIEKDGKIVKGKDESKEGFHARGYNLKSVGICLTGNFDATDPTKAQVASLRTLLRQVAQRHNIDPSKVIPHRTVVNKTCYGRRIGDDWARNLLQNDDPLEVIKTNDLAEELVSRGAEGLIAFVVAYKKRNK